MEQLSGSACVGLRGDDRHNSGKTDNSSKPPSGTLPPPLDFSNLFGRMAPTQVDLGCGDGLFLFQMAQLYPDRNFLGIERLAKRVSKTARKAAQLDNMRVLRVETSVALEVLFAPGSIETFYLLFPDPWPKRRHHRRRIVTTEFLQSIDRALAPNGILRIATDHLDYFRHIQKVVAGCAITQAFGDGFDHLNRSGSVRFEILNEVEEFPKTRFEQRFSAAGWPIYRLSLRKTSPVT